MHSRVQRLAVCGLGWVGALHQQMGARALWSPVKSAAALLTPAPLPPPTPCSVLCLGCTRRLRANATPAAPALCPVCREEVESYIRREFLA